MASETSRVGRVSELIVEATLLSRGWEVNVPSVDEAYDLVAREPNTDEFVRIQVKTIRPRTDRANDLVVYATDGKGRPYTKTNCDIIAGVHGLDVYLIPVNGQREYWSVPTKAALKWRKLSMVLLRPRFPLVK